MEKNEIFQEIERLNTDLFYGSSHIKDNGKVDLFPDIENKPERTFSFEVNYSLLKRELEKLDPETRYAVVKEIVDGSSVFACMKIDNGDSPEEIARYKDYIKMLRYEYLGSYEAKDQKQTVESVIIPEELDTPEAREIFNKAIQAGFMNSDYSFNGTRPQMAYFAEKASEYLKLKYKWKPFIQLWNFKYFPQTRRESIDVYGYVDKQDEIDIIFI